MTEQMKHFLTELAELMERYDIDTAEVTETCHGYLGNTVDGVEFTIIGKYDSKGDPIQKFCEQEIPSFFDADTIRRVIEESK